ncbi:hypothetical protein C8Q70DRAFT_644190 [Cubamyces menziesii]|nr:hypothetical protein C8Q70DRAFT_644190 [Cubamyces menziesii]
MAEPLCCGRRRPAMPPLRCHAAAARGGPGAYSSFGPWVVPNHWTSYVVKLLPHVRKEQEGTGPYWTTSCKTTARSSWRTPRSSGVPPESASLVWQSVPNVPSLVFSPVSQYCTRSTSTRGLRLSPTNVAWDFLAIVVQEPQTYS